MSVQSQLLAVLRGAGALPFFSPDRIEENFLCLGCCIRCHLVV